MSVQPLNELVLGLESSWRDDLVRMQAAVDAVAVPEHVSAIVLTGCGDSVFAAEAIAQWLAPEARAAGVQLTSVPAGHLAFRHVELAQDGVVVVPISTGGATPRTVEAAIQMLNAGAAGVAVAGKPDSALHELCGTSVVTLAEPFKGDTPGLHSYWATLLGVGGLVQRLLGHRHPDWLGKDAALAAVFAALPESVAGVSDDAVSLTDIDRLDVVAHDSSIASGRFVLAKFAEAAGLPGVVSAVGDWLHVGHLAAPPEAVGTVFLGGEQSGGALGRAFAKAHSFAAHLGRPIFDVGGTDAYRQATAGLGSVQFLTDYLLGAVLADTASRQRQHPYFGGQELASSPALPLAVMWQNPQPVSRNSGVSV